MEDGSSANSLLITSYNKISTSLRDRWVGDGWWVYSQVLSFFRWKECKAQTLCILPKVCNYFFYIWYLLLIQSFAKIMYRAEILRIFSEFWVRGFTIGNTLSFFCVLLFLIYNIYWDTRRRSSVLCVRFWFWFWFWALPSCATCTI
jgi:hypothetical protein